MEEPVSRVSFRGQPPRPVIRRECGRGKSYLVVVHQWQEGVVKVGPDNTILVPLAILAKVGEFWVFGQPLLVRSRRKVCFFDGDEPNAVQLSPAQ